MRDPSERTQISFIGDKIRTKQSMKTECDINYIMKVWHKTGEFTHINTVAGNYGDFSSADTYLEALEKVNQAQVDFDALPAEARKRLDHNPANLARFLADPENHNEAVELGLLDFYPELEPAADPDDGAQPPGNLDSAPPQPAPIAGGE